MEPENNRSAEGQKDAKKVRKSEVTLTMDQVRKSFMEARKNLRMLRERHHGILNLLQENQQTTHAIQSFGKQKEHESIIPLGAGVFVKGKIDASTLMRNIPGNIVMPSNQEEIEKELNERKEIFQKELELISKKQQETSAYMRNMQSLGKAMRQANKSKKRA